MGNGLVARQSGAGAKTNRGTVMGRRSLSLVTAAVIGLAASQASAADLPRKAPAYIPPAPPPVTWTGCYIGGNVGGIFGRRSADFGAFGSSRPTPILALLAAVKLAAIINSPADG